MKQKQRQWLALLKYDPPFDKCVVDRFTELGDTATPGFKLLSLYNPLTLRVEALVREELAVSLALVWDTALGQALNVDIPSLSDTA